jgi:hypothetical protein
MVILWYYNPQDFDHSRVNKHSLGIGRNVEGSFISYIKDKGKNSYTTYGNKNISRIGED